MPLDYNRAWPYNKRLGFHVAIDAAARLPRSLPVAALFSLSPPGQKHLHIQTTLLVTRKPTAKFLASLQLNGACLQYSSASGVISSCAAMLTDMHACS